MTIPFLAELTAIEQLFALIFILSILFGAFARKTDFCPLGAVADIFYGGHTGRLWMYFFAIAVAIFSVTLLEFTGVISLDNTRPPYRMPQFRWPGYLFGGLLFGIGMTYCRGCGMKNMLNLGGGNLKSIVAILGMGSAAVLLLYVEGIFDDYFLSWMGPMTPDWGLSGIDHSDLGALAASVFPLGLDQLRFMIGLGLASLIFFAAFRCRDFVERRANIVGGLAVGLLVAGAFYLSGGPVGEVAQEASDFLDQPQNGMGTQSYTFIRPMGDMLYVAANPYEYLVTFGLVAFLGVGAGSLLISILTLNFHLQWFSSTAEAVRYFLGGIMVGVGGILGLGCTLGQGVAGTSTLALGSYLNLGSLIVGTIIGIKLQPNFMDDHKLPS